MVAVVAVACLLLGHFVIGPEQPDPPAPAAAPMSISPVSDDVAVRTAGVAQADPAGRPILVFRPAPGSSTGGGSAQLRELAGATVTGRIVFGLYPATGDGPVRYAITRATGSGTTGGSSTGAGSGGGSGAVVVGSATAPSASTQISLDTSRLGQGSWRVTATSASGTGTAAAFAVTSPATTNPTPSTSTSAPSTDGGSGAGSAGSSGAGSPTGAGMAAITTRGAQLLRGGQPWWLVGMDSFVWSGDCGDPGEKMNPQQVDAWFSSMRHDGHGAVRLFFYKGWNTAALDQAVASATRNNVYVTVTLDDAIGGCGATKKDASWFTNQADTGAYQQHLTQLVTKYKGNPTIAWFEYFNEPTDAGGALRKFYDQMGALAHQIDPDRLFSSGTLAPYDTGGASGYQQINASPGVAIASLHEYDENETESNHGPEARQNSAGKPVIVGEVGIKAGAGCATSDQQRAQKFTAKAAAYTRPGYAGMLAWAWGKRTGCDYENLDADPASQTALRTAGPGSPTGGSSGGSGSSDGSGSTSSGSSGASGSSSAAAGSGSGSDAGDGR